MLAAELQARMEAAHQEAERARDLLLRPSLRSLDECRTALGSAISSLANCSDDWPQGDNAVLLGQARRLRLAVAHTGYLLQTAAGHHARWQQIFQSRMAGYTSGGDPGEISSAPRVLVRG